MLEPALGPNSVLTLDDAPHMQQRKLLLPPFHGERIRGYGELIRETTPQADGELAGRRAVRAAPPHPADHPGGDHARRLRRPRRAAPGPLRGPDRRLQQAGRPDHHDSPPCAATSALEPLAALPALARGARRVHLRGDRPAPQGGRSRRGGPRRRALAAAAGPPRRRQPDERRRAARRARHRARRRPRDDRDRAGLGDGAAAAHAAGAGQAARLDRRRRGRLPRRHGQRDAAGAAGDRRRRPQADRAGPDRRLRAAQGAAS